MDPNTPTPNISPVEIYPQAPGVAPQGQTPIVATPPPAKKGFPKILFIIPAILILLVVVFFVGRGILSRMKSGGEGAIVWWGLWEDESIVAPLIAEYQASHPKVNIKYQRQSPQDYRERLTNALAKGTGPDIFRFHNTWVPMFKDDLDAVPVSVMSAGE
ncbi:MAG: extracellular solute-binding protein, partial [Patescibacteria group bacterium]